MAEKTTLRSVQLENNNIKDRSTIYFLKNVGLATILKGVLKGQKIKKLSIEKNELLRESAETLCKVLSLQPPLYDIVVNEYSFLESLTISECKMTSTPLETILKVLQNRCYLKRLRLIKAGLNAQALDVIADIVNNQNTLASLDISWNDFPQKGKYYCDFNELVFADFLYRID